MTGGMKKSPIRESKYRVSSRRFILVLSVIASCFVVFFLYFNSEAFEVIGSEGFLHDEAQGIGYKSKCTQLDAKGRPPLKIAVVSTYFPQRCGIAEFAYETLKSLKLSNHKSNVIPDVEVGVVVLNPEEYSDISYGSEVSFVIRKHILADYIAAATFVNTGFDVVLIEHEYGIFGGIKGDYLFTFLKHLTIPVVCTLHTVLGTTETRFEDLVYFLEHMRVLAPKATLVNVALNSLCKELDGVSPGSLAKCSHIPVGIPVVVPDTGSVLKKYGHLMRGRLKIVTAGLIGESKGIQYMIQAMTGVAKKFPNATYFVVGQEHTLSEVANYLSSLRKLVDDNRLGNNVQFISEFQKKSDLYGWVRLADVIVIPYIDPGQTSSGMLSLGMGLERPVVATRFQYAVHLCLPDSQSKKAWDVATGKVALPEGAAPLKGKYCHLVDLKNATQLSEAVVELLGGEEARRKLGKVAKRRTEGMTWLDVAKKTVAQCREAKQQACEAVRQRRAPVISNWKLDRLAKQLQDKSGGPRQRLKKWAAFLAVVQSLVPGASSLEVSSLLPFLQRGSSSLKRLSFLAMESLSYSGLLFSRWIPRTKEFRFDVQESGFFTLRDNVKTVHGRLGHGFFLSYAEHDMVLGRGPYLDWPYAEFNLAGVQCDQVDERRNLQWGYEVNGTKAVLWATADVICVKKGEEMVLGVLRSNFEAALDELFVENTVEVTLVNAPEPDSTVNVLTNLKQLSNRFRDVSYSHFYPFFSNSSGDPRVPTKNDFRLYDQSPSDPVHWYLVTNAANERGIFVKVHSRDNLLLVNSWDENGDMKNTKGFMDVVQSKYVWNANGGQNFQVREDIFVSGIVDPRKLQAYNQLFKEKRNWPGVDFSLASDKERIWEGVDAFRQSLNKKSSEASHIHGWLTTHRVDGH